MQRVWKWLCSLKLAVTLASVATLTIMVGSVRIPAHPDLFGQLDSRVLGDWLRGPGADHPALSWWVFVASITLVLFGLNTLCCFIDWLGNLRARWRKTGEYLLHLGFCLVLVAYVGGSFYGSRAHPLAVPLDATRPVPERPGYYLHLAQLEPLVDSSGRPLDYPQELHLYHGDTLLTRQQVRLNHPLLWHDMVVIPESAARVSEGFRFFDPKLGASAWRTGTRLLGPDGTHLDVEAFYPHLQRLANGELRPVSEQLVNPGFLLNLKRNDAPLWRGWYLLREGLPAELLAAGFAPRPLEPLQRPLTLLKVYFDPGAPLAAAGGFLMGVGSLVTLFSYYAKRRRGERPEVD